MRISLLRILSLSFACAVVRGQDPLPEPTPAPLPPPIAEAVNRPYPGNLLLRVDGTDVVHKIFRVSEIIPVQGSGPLTLLYPKWLPGTHGPGGPVANLAGLVIRARSPSGDQPVEWTRDTVEMTAFHVAVPAGATALALDFQFLSPVDARQGDMAMTPQMLVLEWNTVVFYPAGFYVSRLEVEPTLVVPTGWRSATALGPATGDAEIRYRPVSLETLVDSPVFAGRYFRQLDLDPGSDRPIRLDIFADDPRSLAINPRAEEAFHQVVKQAERLMGSRHYDHYDFLLGLSASLGGLSLEHHRCSENVTLPEFFTHWDTAVITRDLLGHEYLHSWNGKFRRPADLWAPDFNRPEQDDLLWVYEGQTDFWGKVLETRAGVISHAQFLDLLAFEAATFDHRPGRAWRSLQDTTNQPILLSAPSGLSQAIQWGSWERNQDYYWEGVLLWLDVDTLILERTQGGRSLDDFARAFFGIDDGSFGTVTYTFDDVVRALNDVAPYDWASFLRTRLDGHARRAPLDGLARGGYRLVYTDQDSAFYHSGEKPRSVADFDFSLGFVVDRDGVVSDVNWVSPSFDTGLTDGMRILAVNGGTFDTDRLRRAVAEASRKGAPPIHLTVQDGDRIFTLALDYHGGLRYPHLERIDGSAGYLDRIIAPRN
jgi:predicted metalloprotease with PDZ domain